MAARAGMLFGRLGSHWFKELHALPHQAFVRSEGHRALLGIVTLHGHEPRGRARGCLRNGFRISLVVFLPFDKRLYIRRLHQSYLVALGLRHVAPVMRGGAGIHRNYAARLPCEKCH